MAGLDWQETVAVDQLSIIEDITLKLQDIPVEDSKK